MKNPFPVAFRASVSYDGGQTFKGGGPVSHATFTRNGEAGLYRDNLTIWAGGQNSNRDLTLTVSDPSRLPEFLVDLLLVARDEGDEDERVEDFNNRLSLRDEVAVAMEKAAARLRSAPRR
ncbi:hypothetical protein SAMN03080618_03343 [Aquamicrobium aerolatum DSM 21857]|uniref:Uncharacterized protein n=1 Tax=Aquamicrobium aerolatum DSM 21857 TaxID=1121003 RepID=A0A1I3SE66_9HYPH|nr:hypothetical protein SAMN03080618_03343 [Aquamicrobium aerolatum DSM 21857]